MCTEYNWQVSLYGPHKRLHYSTFTDFYTQDNPTRPNKTRPSILNTMAKEGTNEEKFSTGGRTLLRKATAQSVIEKQTKDPVSWRTRLSVERVRVFAQAAFSAWLYRGLGWVWSNTSKSAELGNSGNNPPSHQLTYLDFVLTYYYFLFTCNSSLPLQRLSSNRTSLDLSRQTSYVLQSQSFRCPTQGSADPGYHSGPQAEGIMYPHCICSLLQSSQLLGKEKLWSHLQVGAALTGLSGVVSLCR